MISSLEKKPDSGGRPAIASQATTIPNAVYGRNFRNRPMIRMSWLSWFPWITEPAPRNKQPL